jgi:hypothetical protein
VTLVVAVAVAMTVAGGLGAVLVLEQKGGTPTSAWADGPTLYQALGEVNTTVRNTTGGPWELFSYIGLAAEATFNPAAFGFVGSNNLSQKSCDLDLNGITLWNGSAIPTFDGSIASGTAPFWQFEFSSISTTNVIVATDILGVVKLYRAIAPSDPCWNFVGGVGAASYFSWVNPLPEDSSIQAQLAFNRVADSFETKNRPVVEIFANGLTPLGAIGHGPYGGVELYRCGIVGIAGVQPYLNIGFSPNGSIFDVGTGDLTCTATYSMGPPPVYVPYAFEWNLPDIAPWGTGVTRVVDSILTTFQVGVARNITYYDAWGLLSWMIMLSLRAANGTALPSAPIVCGTWYPSPGDCTISSAGWSAILVSANGAGLSTFPSATNASSWTVLDASMVSQEQIWLTCPSSWNLSGDTLVVSGSSSVPTVTGSLAL